MGSTLDLVCAKNYELLVKVNEKAERLESLSSWLLDLARPRGRLIRVKIQLKKHLFTMEDSQLLVDSLRIAATHTVGTAGLQLPLQGLRRPRPPGQHLLQRSSSTGALRPAPPAHAGARLAFDLHLHLRKKRKAYETLTTLPFLSLNVFNSIRFSKNFTLRGNKPTRCSRLA